MIFLQLQNSLLFAYNWVLLEVENFRRSVYITFQCTTYHRSMHDIFTVTKQPTFRIRLSTLGS